MESDDGAGTGLSSAIKSSAERLKKAKQELDEEKKRIESMMEEVRRKNDDADRKTLETKRLMEEAGRREQAAMDKLRDIESRDKRLMEEIGYKEKAVKDTKELLEMKEKELDKREGELNLLFEKSRALEEKVRTACDDEDRIHSAETDLDAREKGLIAKQESLITREQALIDSENQQARSANEVNSKREEVNRRESEVARREEAISKREIDEKDRQKALAEAEAALKARELEVLALEESLVKERQAFAKEQEALNALRQSLLEKEKELLNVEKELEEIFAMEGDVRRIERETLAETAAFRPAHASSQSPEADTESAAAKTGSDDIDESKPAEESTADEASEEEPAKEEAEPATDEPAHEEEPTELTHAQKEEPEGDKPKPKDAAESFFSEAVSDEAEKSADAKTPSEHELKEFIADLKVRSKNLEGAGYDMMKVNQKIDIAIVRLADGKRASSHDEALTAQKAIEKAETELATQNEAKPEKTPEKKTGEGKEDMKCPYCGESNRQGASKCQRCGSAFTGEGGTASEEKKAKPEDAKKESKDEKKMDIGKGHPDILSCPNCSAQINYIEQYERYYCYKCGKYAPHEFGKSPVNLRQQLEDAQMILARAFNAGEEIADARAAVKKAREAHAAGDLKSMRENLDAALAPYKKYK